MTKTDTGIMVWRIWTKWILTPILNFCPAQKNELSTSSFLLQNGIFRSKKKNVQGRELVQTMEQTSC